jgi:uncharacterized membrane protein YfcA
VRSSWQVPASGLERWVGVQRNLTNEEVYMTIAQGIGLFLAAIVGGTMNAVAGGGSFITFPTLYASGIPAISANATSTVSLWPGAVASIGAYRGKLKDRKRVILLVVASLIGGLFGAQILLRTPQATFLSLVPWLLLAATLLFAFGGRLTASLREGITSRPAHPVVTTILLMVMQFIIATYGGFFGGGIGILMLAVFSVAGMQDINSMNALKVVLAASINGIAVLSFIIAGAVVWQAAAVMVVGAVIGGYGGASVARRLDPRIVRGFVIVVGCAVTLYFFVR